MSYENPDYYNPVARLCKELAEWGDKLTADEIFWCLIQELPEEKFEKLKELF